MDALQNGNMKVLVYFSSLLLQRANIIKYCHFLCFMSRQLMSLLCIITVQQSRDRNRNKVIRLLFSESHAGQQIEP